MITDEKLTLVHRDTGSIVAQLTNPEGTNE